MKQTNHGLQRVEFKINKLGAIRDSSMVLSPMMIFSGESGLGKSYAAFFIHYLYTVLLESKRLYGFFEDNRYTFPTDPKLVTPDTPVLSISTNSLLNWLNKDAVSYIGYLVGNQHLEADIELHLPIENNDNFDFYFSEELRGLNNQEEIFYKITLNDFTYSVISNEYKPSSEPYVALIKANLRELIFGSMDRITTTHLLPPSRGSLMEINEHPNFQSGMYEEFFSCKALINSPQKIVRPISSSILECCIRLNDGEIIREAGKYVYKMRNGNQMPLTAAASSIKELSPLTLLLNKYPISSSSILFEEPEAHVHPNRQVKLADLLACIINEGGHLQITTHSDYLIKRLNNLMKLDLLKKRLLPKEFDKITQDAKIKNDYLLDATKVRAYLLKDNGDGTSIIEEQSLGEDCSIPFESFYSVIEDDIKLSRIIDSLLD